MMGKRGAMDKTDIHNRLGREFVMKAGRETADYASLLVVIESVIFATMLLLCRLYHFSPSSSTAMVEMAFQRATERFAEQEKAQRAGPEGRGE